MTSRQWRQRSRYDLYRHSCRSSITTREHRTLHGRPVAMVTRQQGWARVMWLAASVSRRFTACSFSRCLANRTRVSRLEFTRMIRTGGRTDYTDNRRRYHARRFLQSFAQNQPVLRCLFYFVLHFCLFACYADYQFWCNQSFSKSRAATHD